jgi:hypothetical protein
MEERDILDNPDKTAGHTYAAVTGEHPGFAKANMFPVPIMPQWKPIDTAPENEPILVWCPEAHRGLDSAEVVVLYRDEQTGELDFWTNGGANAGSDFQIEPSPTHWMPLPAPPTAP